jgi:hypothetical protein
MSDSLADSGTPEAQQKTNLKAYNAIVKLQDSTKNDTGRSKTRSATFLAAIRFIEAPLSNESAWDRVPISAKWPPLPGPRDIYRHIGVSPLSPDANGAMWDTIFIDRLKNSESVFDLDEVNLIGRSLEKILQVDLIPISFSGDKRETALVSNLFLRPSVDLKSLL